MLGLSLRLTKQALLTSLELEEGGQEEHGDGREEGEGRRRRALRNLDQCGRLRILWHIVHFTPVLASDFLPSKQTKQSVRCGADVDDCVLPRSIITSVNQETRDSHVICSYVVQAMVDVAIVKTVLVFHRYFSDAFIAQMFGNFRACVRVQLKKTW